MRILFTSVGRRVELIQAFREAAKILKIDLQIHGADIVKSAPALSFCDYEVQAPKIRDASYIPFLQDYCKKNSIDALIPTIDTDLLILADTKGKFGDTRVIISDFDKISICRDKRLTAEYFLSLGLRTPLPVDDWHEYHGEFPAFIKPRDGSSSVLAYRVKNQEELLSYSSQIPDYIVQPYIEGTEYTIDVFCDFKGEPVYITPRIRIATRAGEVLKTRISQDRTIINEVTRIINDFKPCGPLTVQMIREKYSNANYYIEINPRFGGGAPLSMKAGANSALAMLQMLSGAQMSYVADAAEDGAVYSRYDQSVRVEL